PIAWPVADAVSPADRCCHQVLQLCAHVAAAVIHRAAGWVARPRLIRDVGVSILGNRRALTVTVTVLALIASAAHAGLRRIPSDGYSTPAASGIAIRL